MIYMVAQQFVADERGLGIQTQSGDFIPVEQWVSALATEKLFVMMMIESIDGVYMEEYMEPIGTYSSSVGSFNIVFPTTSINRRNHKSLGQELVDHLGYQRIHIPDNYMLLPSMQAGCLDIKANSNKCITLDPISGQSDDEEEKDGNATSVRESYVRASASPSKRSIGHSALETSKNPN